MLPSDPLGGTLPENILIWTKSIIDPITGKTIEGYAFTAEDCLTRPDWVDFHQRRFIRQAEYYLRTGRIE